MKTSCPPLLRLALAAAACVAACAPPQPSVAAPNPAPGPSAGAAPALVTPPAPATAVTAVATSSALTVEVLPRFGKVVPKAETLDVLVRLKGADRPGAVRPPLDLVVVIDRSGSMEGDKLRSVKAAALDLVKRLAPHDRLTLLSYSDSVETHFSHRPMDAAGLADARREVLALNADGSTALGPALAGAFAALRGRPQPGTDRLAHVLLMSDGIANVGEARPEVLGALAAEAFREGMSLSTLGVGLDYAEDLMTKVADEGGGRYHFVKNDEDVAGVLADELKGLVATVAAQTTVTLALPDHVKVARVYGYPTSDEKGRVTIRVGGLGAGVTREIIVKLALTAPLGKAPGEVSLGRFVATFRDVGNDGVQARAEGVLSVGLTDDARVAASSERDEVAVRVTEVEAADKLEIAARSVESGNFEAADQALDNSLRQLRAEQAARPAPSARIQVQIEELESARGSLGAAAASSEDRKDYVKARKAASYRTQK